LKAADYQETHRPVIELCRLGDRKAQYQLYKLYAKAMYNVSLRICGNTAEAEDILQEAFLNAFQHLHTFQYQAAFGAWLKRIVINQAIGVLRKRRLDLTPMSEKGLEVAEETAGTAEEEMQWEVEKIKTAMKKLPEGYRVVLSLYLFEGYDHAEIASILNISESTSKTQFLRAKKKLISFLSESGLK
jgi:RNA polymerase sigma factor (sigma-70 family)